MEATQEQPPKGLVPIQVILDRFGVTRWAIQQARRRGLLKAYKAGNARLFDPDEVERWIREANHGKAN